MPDELKVKQSLIRLMKGDITALEIEAFVYYARPDLVLGTGFGGAISVRGGPKIQEELKKLGVIRTGEAVTTSAGNMKAKYIIHAAGPRFQEEDLEDNNKRAAAGGRKGNKAFGLPGNGRRLLWSPSGSLCPDNLGRSREILRKHQKPRRSGLLPAGFLGV